jgi:hypothetical protein
MIQHFCNSPLSSANLERFIELKIKQFQQGSIAIGTPPSGNSPEVVDGVFVTPPAADHQSTDLGKMWKDSRQEDSSIGEPVISPDRGNSKDTSPFIRLYNLGAKVFRSSYNTIEADLDTDSNQTTIVVESHNGMYYLVRFEESRFYLIPRHDLKIGAETIATLQRIFEFGETSNSYRLVNAAIASLLPSSGNRKWQIEQRGILDFDR